MGAHLREVLILPSQPACCFISLDLLHQPLKGHCEFDFFKRWYLKEAVPDGLARLFNFQDHFCSLNIIVCFISVNPKHRTGTAAKSAFAYLCCHTAQFVFLRLQSRAAKLPPYHSCKRWASPLQPLGWPHGWLTIRSQKSTYSSEHRIISPPRRRKYGRSHRSVRIHVWLCSVCIYRATWTYRQLSAQPHPNLSHSSLYWINCTMTNQQVCAVWCVQKTQKNGTGGDRCQCVFITCSSPDKSHGWVAMSLATHTHTHAHSYAQETGWFHFLKNT